MINRSIKEFLTEDWLFCQNEIDPKHGIYKLHIALAIEEFDEYSLKVYEELKKGVKNGTIPKFKQLNVEPTEELMQPFHYENITLIEHKNFRLINNPFTIYLYESFNPEDVTKLCKEIECILASAKTASRNYLSIADLDLLPHITFRQEELNGEYIKIAIATEEELAELKKQGENSEKYHHLKEACKQYFCDDHTNEEIFDTRLSCRRN